MSKNHKNHAFATTPEVIPATDKIIGSENAEELANVIESATGSTPESTETEQPKVTVNPGDNLQDAVARFKELKARQVALKQEIKEAKEKHKAAVLAAKGNNLSTTYTRVEATVWAINYGGTVETITDAADKKYAQMNPDKKQPRNIKEAQAVARFVFQTMSALGILQFNSDTKQYQISDNFKTAMKAVA